MKAKNACIPCIMKQAYNTARRATKDTVKIRKILDETANYCQTLDLDQAPADASNYVYEMTREITGNDDPYREEKKRYNDLCLGMIDDLRREIEKRDDPLYAAARVAILGNVIDLGIGYAFDLDEELKNIFSVTLPQDDFKDFKQTVSSGRKNILYLADNCGEIVFDRLFIERLKENHDVTLVVKQGPIINDATMIDAEYVGLKSMVRTIDTGSASIGVRWSMVSEEFVAAYDAADVIVSKGQGNFETMSDRDKDIYFLLRAKCDSVADMLGVKTGDIVFKRGPVK